MKHRMLGGITGIVLSVTTLISMSACFPQDSSDRLTPITLNEVAHSIFYAPQYVAIENGYFEEEGISLTLVTGFGADKVMTSLVSGDADIGFMGSESSVYVYNEGSADYAVNFAQLTQRAGNFLVSRTPQPDFNWDSLRGSTVLGGRTGGMPEMILEYILKNKGIDYKNDLTIIQNIDFGSTAGAFKGSPDDYDYTVEFEPHATLLENEGAGYVVSSLGIESGYVPYTAYCAKKSYIKNHPEIIQSFTNAIQKGINYVNTHTPEEIATVIAPQFPETESKDLVKIIDRYKQQDSWKDNTVFSEDSFNLLLDILESSGELKSRVPYEVLVNTEFAERAK